MKKYNLIYKNKKMCVFNNLDVERMKGGLQLDRGTKEVYEDEKEAFSNGKSEIVVYESEEYKRLKNEEERPYLVYDSENRCYQAKMQTVSEQMDYFVFLEAGDDLEIFDVERWYNFTLKNMTVVSEQEVDKMTKSLNKTAVNDVSEPSNEGVDFDEHFDDDDATDKIVYIQKTKKLTESGSRLQHLVDELDTTNPKTYAEETQEEPIEEAKKNKKVLNEKALIKIFGNRTITIKELLRILSKANYALDEEEKATIKLFLQQRCKYETNKNTKEKLFKLI